MLFVNLTLFVIVNQIAEGARIPFSVAANNAQQFQFVYRSLLFGHTLYFKITFISSVKIIFRTTSHLPFG